MRIAVTSTPVLPWTAIFLPLNVTGSVMTCPRLDEHRIAVRRGVDRGLDVGVVPAAVKVHGERGGGEPRKDR